MKDWLIKKLGGYTEKDFYDLFMELNHIISSKEEDLRRMKLKLNEYINLKLQENK